MPKMNKTKNQNRVKKTIKIFIGILIIGIVIKIYPAFIKFTPTFSIFNFPINFNNWFSRIEKRGNLDITWDYVIVDGPEKVGRSKWEIGLVDNKINIYETATGPVVRAQTFKDVDMSYTSMRDYYSHGGPESFRRFVEERNK